jgi:hypothetical protein
MSLDAAWALAQNAAFSTMGVPAVVTRPSPSDAPIETSLIWVNVETQSEPGAAEFVRRERVRIAVLDRDDVPTVPKNTRIVAAEREGGPERTWRVDGIDRSEPDQMRVIVVEVPA